MKQDECVLNSPTGLVSQIRGGAIQHWFFSSGKWTISEGFKMEIEPETLIPVALITSCRKAATSKGWVPPRHSDSSLTTLGPQSVNTGLGRFGDSIIVRRMFRCCVDWNLTRVRYSWLYGQEVGPTAPCQSDLSHKRQHNPRKGPTKQWPQEVRYSVVENIEFEFALCSRPESM